jgi:spore germination cell wall hydrolase CwlJ-like protein
MTRQGRIGALIALILLLLFAYTSTGKPSKPVVYPLDISHIKPIKETPDPIFVDASDFLVKIDPEDFECMRLNLYYEAGNQKAEDAYAAVGYTVINRTKTKGYPSSICGVVKEKRRNPKTGRIVCQYSWYCDGKSDVPKLMVKNAKGKLVPNVAEQKAWARAGEIAKQVLRNEVDNPIGRATMYHANYVKPGWKFNELRHVKTIESHIFYIETKRKYHA